MSGIVTTLPIAPGALLHNKYEPMQMIGGGNFGEVWLAKDHAVDHTYAIKILKPGVTVVNQRPFENGCGGIGFGDSSLGCGPERAVAGWPISHARPSVTPRI